MPRKSAPKPWTTKKLAIRIARLADEKQAADIVVLDVAQAIQVSDWFVVCTGQNRRHMGVVAESVAKELKKEGFYRMGGSPAADENWVLLDFGPVVLHVFSAKSRRYYDLENLWGDCPRVKWKAKPKPQADAVAEESRGLGAGGEDAAAAGADETAADEQSPVPA